LTSGYSIDSPAICLDYSGNVGIGTSTPSGKFHVNGSSSIFGNTGASNIIINDIAQAKWMISTGGYALTFSKHNNASSSDYSSWSAKMTIDSNGNLGIGNTAPTRMLTVGAVANPSPSSVGTTAITSYGNIYLHRNRLIFSNADTDWNHSIYNNYYNLDGEGSWDGLKMNVFNGLSVRVGNAGGVTPTTALYVNSSGNVGLGTTNINNRLEVSGNISATGDITGFNNASDIRLKKNIKPLYSSLSIIESLNPVTFTWKDDIYNQENRNKDDVGFIAQELQEIIPLATGEFKVDENIYKKIKHERIIPYLVKSIQELYSIIKDLRS
jgi:hypothetical protein